MPRQNFEVGTRWRCVNFVSYANKVINGIIEITEKGPCSFRYKIIEGMENDTLPYIFEPRTGFAYHLYPLEEDFMKHTFTKVDLKTGDVIKHRNGDTRIVISEFNTLIGKDVGLNLNCFQEDLTARDNNLDIVAVRRPYNNSQASFDAFKFGYGDLVYEREEVEEMTLAEVCKLLGKNIKIIK